MMKKEKMVSVVSSKVYEMVTHPVVEMVMKVLSKSDAEKAALKAMVVHGMMMVGAA